MTVKFTTLKPHATLENPTKIGALGGSVDITARQGGSFDALKDLGIAPDLGETVSGIKAEKPPELKPVPAHTYTTSGALLNPKVASADDAPNYGPASSSITSCVACSAYQKQDKVMGHCSRYDFYANGGFTCDAWSRPPLATLTPDT